MRPLAERRARHAALRDVAGMLRSLAYAEAAASRERHRPMPAASAFRPGQSAPPRCFSRLTWTRYRACPAALRSRRDAERIVRFFMLEKALYEVVYELANRPDWVDIPLRRRAEVA